MYLPVPVDGTDVGVPDEAYAGWLDCCACATTGLHAAAAARELYDELSECRGSWNMYG